jgi:hypothetical protein
MTNIFVQKIILRKEKEILFANFGFLNGNG